MYEIKKLEGSKYEVKITREKEEIGEMRKEAIKTLKKNVKMDGFRQGHVPDSVIEKNYEGNIKEEIANKVIEEEYPGILEKEGIKPIDYLKIKEFNVDGDKLELIGEIQVMPNGTDIRPIDDSTADTAAERFGLTESPALLFVGQMHWKKNIKRIRFRIRSFI